MLEWMGKLALELIAQAGLGYSFKALEGENNEYATALKTYAFVFTCLCMKSNLPRRCLDLRTQPNPIERPILAPLAPDIQVHPSRAHPPRYGDVGKMARSPVARQHCGHHVLHFKGALGRQEVARRVWHGRDCESARGREGLNEHSA